MEQIPLGRNKVELTGLFGSDETHALSAWTSTSRDLSEEKSKRMGGLLRMLAREGHHTPFEKSYLQFLVTCETASHIHILKHRIGTSCVTGDTLIHTLKSENVNKRTIKELYEEQENGIQSYSVNGKPYRRKYGRPIPVRSKNSKNNLIERDYIEEIYYNGIKEVYKFTTESGKEIKTTLDHLFYSEGEWKEIGEYLGVKKINNRAVFTNKDNLVATNGVQLDDPKRPWTSKAYFDDVENKMTRHEAAKHLNMKYDNLKKWGYIHNIQFLIDDVNTFKKGQIPWNLGVYGYKAPRQSLGLSKEVIETNQDKYKNEKVWRAAVGNWTREQLPKLMEKYEYQCQGPLEYHSRDFNAHHIIPVYQDKEKALDYDNLILVCVDCHKHIHSSLETEQWFVDNHSDIKVSLKKKPRKCTKLSIGYERIVSVEYIGYEEVYDLQTRKNHNYIADGYLIHNCNGESARYKELKEDKGYVPSDWPEEMQKEMDEFNDLAFNKYHDAIERLVEKGYDRKRAKESARLYLPYANQLQLDVSFNFRSFMHFQGLRNKEDAQGEIRAIANEMLRLVKETDQFPLSLEGFGYGEPDVKISE